LNDPAGHPIAIFPAVLLRAGDDKPLLPRFGFAIPGRVQVCVVSDAILRGRQQAQESHIPALHPSGAAWRLAKDHDVLGHRTVQAEPQANTPAPPCNQLKIRLPRASKGVVIALMANEQVRFSQQHQQSDMGMSLNRSFSWSGRGLYPPPRPAWPRGYWSIIPKWEDRHVWLITCSASSVA
jgi:hypothetical protein